MVYAVVVGMAYLLGSIPSGYLVARTLAGKNLLRSGTGNLGGLNAARVAGLPAGLITAALDIGKGALAVHLARVLAPGSWAPLLAGLAAVVGHNWMLFLGTKGGGKGLATSTGAMLLLLPAVIPIAAALMALLALAFRSVYMGVVAALLILPPVLYLLGGHLAWGLFGAALSAAIIAKHAGNIQDYLDDIRRPRQDQSPRRGFRWPTGFARGDR
ncbi:MAG TPA: glycerol-3-phosphate acyltransferase [Clostridiales bacterium]|nr:glycerol-3-phosphate acyltransferase [Clostridiales bacterium]